jgi:hypothetical protein
LRALAERFVDTHTRRAYAHRHFLRFVNHFFFHFFFTFLNKILALKKNRASGATRSKQPHPWTRSTALEISPLIRADRANAFVLAWDRALSLCSL